MGIKMKISIVTVIMFLVVFWVVTILGLSIRPAIGEAEELISSESAPFRIEFRNDNWIEGAILAEDYVDEAEYIKVINYYNRYGFHKEIKYIPKDWIISISDRR